MISSYTPSSLSLPLGNWPTEAAGPPAPSQSHLQKGLFWAAGTEVTGERVIKKGEPFLTTAPAGTLAQGEHGLLATLCHPDLTPCSLCP